MANVNIKTLALGRKDVFMLDPTILKCPAWNMRDDTAELQEHIETISRSIAKVGFLPDRAVVAYQEGGEFFLSDGKCRLAGTLLAIKNGADIKAIPVILEPRGSNEADRIAGMLTRNSGKNLTPLEQGRVYKRLQAFGWDDQRIADVSGKSLSHVKHIFTLMEATPVTQAQIVAGEVAASVVVQAVREHGPAKAETVVQDAVGDAKRRGRKRATGAAVAAQSATKEDKPIQGDLQTVVTAVAAAVQATCSESTERTSAAVVDFFRITLQDQDGTPAVRALAELVMRYKRNVLTDEEFAHALELQMGA